MTQLTHNSKGRLKGSRLSLGLRNNSGQSLIIALSVMFIMVFLGTVFVTLIARNLQNAVRSGDVLGVRQLAEAGVDYADRMLTNSVDGADWRPEPDNVDPAAAPRHPDIQWVRPYSATEDANGASGPSGGFTTYNTGNGRFLLRISYNPDPADPLSRYIKIESIGRMGVVQGDPSRPDYDPTTLAVSGSVRLRHYLTAYKPIGITDYARFVTNKQKRSDVVTLGRAIGSAPLLFGGRIAGQDRSAPIRVNGNLKWQGPIEIFLRGVGSEEGPLPVDSVDVAGQISHDTDAVVNVNTYGLVPTTQVLPSSDPLFNTVGGFYRDGSDMPEDPSLGGHSRSIKRLEPPLIDQLDPTARNTRYRLLTRYTGPVVNIRGSRRQYQAGRWGHGDGIYIDNRRDTQEEGSSIFGGVRTLVSEWTHPEDRANWQGFFYVPPGAVIRLTPGRVLITRTDTVRGGQKFVWYGYDVSARELFPDYGAGPTYEFPYPANGVIFAEGNIRISGAVGADRQLTVVSNENIYIDGPIVKEDHRTSSIALLARKNVVVNTTQFFSLPPAGFGIPESIPGGGRPPFAFRVTTSPATNFRGGLMFGWWYSATAMQSAGDYPDPVRLFLRHASGGATASINLLVNGDPYAFPDGRFNYLMADPLTQYSPTFEGLVLPMDFAGTSALDPTPGFLNSFEIGLNQVGFEQTRGDYLLEAAAVQPLDVSIQSLCYAQEGSFFIIPGRWFNSDPDDLPQQSRQGSARPAAIKDPAFPFHGDPLDIKITIDGAVSENLPASEGDVTLWMKHWSNIPSEYGSSGQPTLHPGDGITFVYDPRIGFPMGVPDAAQNDGMRNPREDAFGRALPAAPKLPVSPDLIYVGRLSG